MNRRSCLNGAADEHSSATHVTKRKCEHCQIQCEAFNKVRLHKVLTFLRLFDNFPALNIFGLPPIQNLNVHALPLVMLTVVR